jgi:hypothetical protein
MNSNIHVKVQYTDEIRRFSCDPVFSILQATVIRLFSLGDVTFVLKYVDDENDLCTISTQLELDYAVSHSPLRLKVIKTSDTPAVDVDPFPASQRVEFLKEKLAFVEKTLEKPDLPSHRLENLTKRKAILEWKLQRLQFPDSYPVFPCDPKNGPGCFRGRGGPRGWKQNQTSENLTGLPACAQQTGPGCFRGRGGARGCWKQGWQANPQMQEVHKEIMALRDIFRAKRIAAHNAKQNGAPQAEVEALFEEFVVARDNLRAKKLVKEEIKDSMIKARVLECNGERQEAVLVQPVEEPVCHERNCQELVGQNAEEPIWQKKRCQQKNPEIAAIQNEIVGLRQIVWNKREALAQARRSGATSEEIEALFEAFVTARTNLREKKVAKRNIKQTK